MTKLLGAIFVIAACVLYGYQSLLKKRETVRALRTTGDDLTELARAVGFSLETLPDAIHRLGKKPQEEESGFLTRLSLGLSSEPSATFSVLWQRVLTEFAKEKHFPQKAETELCTLGENLGKTDFETEQNRITQAAQCLLALMSEKEEENKKQEQTVKSLSVLLGAFLVILLL